jgi:hypothetical protein
VRLIAKFFLVAWLMVALSWLSTAQAETPVPDTELSSRLTDYLHAHRLPLVGAQVLSSGAGRSVMLYGYTATDFGKSDAEAKARRFLKDADIAVNNHIRVMPELASMKSSSPRASASSPPMGTEAPPPDASAYQNQQQDTQQQYLNQQAQAYMNQGNAATNWANALIPLLGLGMGIGIGGGGTSFGMGASPGFGGSIGGFGGSPFNNSPYGNPYGGYGNPYPGSPYGPSNPYP